MPLRMCEDKRTLAVVLMAASMACGAGCAAAGRKKHNFKTEIFRFQ
jgi:hypothetical protein